jgi:hypothetical protein
MRLRRHRPVKPDNDSHLVAFGDDQHREGERREYRAGEIERGENDDGRAQDNGSADPAVASGVGGFEGREHRQGLEPSPPKVMRL